MKKVLQPQIIVKPYKKKTKKKRKRLVIGILIVCLVLSISIYLFLSWMVKKEQREIEKIKKENSFLRKEIKELVSSNSSYEKILRTQYGFIKDGEKILIYSE